MRWITAGNLETWAATLEARAKLPELISNLIWASAREIGTIRFPSGDKSQIHGFDGHLVASGVPFVSDGESFWELGTNEDYVKKANRDIGDRSKQMSAEKRAESAFVFVTLRAWNQSGDNELQDWKERKRHEFGWKDVVVIDGVILEDWLERYPPVSSRFARYELHLAPQRGARSTDEFWDEYASRFKVPITEQVLLCQRDDTIKRILTHLRSGPGSLVLRADSPDEAIAFAIVGIRKADDDTRQFLEAKTVVLDNDEAAREVAERSDLIFIPRGTVTISPRLARTASTLIAVGRDRLERDSYVRLDLPATDAFSDAIKTMGVGEEQSRLLARACARSVTILMRTFPNGDAGVPEWSKEGQILIPALLAGAWDSAFEADQKIVRELARFDAYEKYEEQLRHFQRMDDPPIDREETVWKIRAPVDAFVHLGHLLGPADFARLQGAVVEVFSEVDYSLDKPVPSTTFNQPKPRHSSCLRDGLATTLLQIAIHHEGADLQISGTTPQAFVDDLISSLPGLSSDWRLIASLREELPLLMEAAPRPFLDALERLLQYDGVALRAIFREGGFLSPFSPHLYLLAALEILGWDPAFLMKVSLILARLTKIDPGGTVSNRPINSLMEIFMPWHPNTHASQEQRLAIIRQIVRDVPEMGWQLTVKLLPTMHSVGQYNPKPKYREAGGSEKEVLTRGMVLAAYTSIIEIAISLANGHADRWSLLVRDMANFAQAHRIKMCQLLETFLQDASEKERRQVWESIREEVSRHIAFKDAKRALPHEELEPFSRLIEKFAPSNPIARISWLFDQQSPDLPGKPDNPEGAAEARGKALRELIDQSGIDSVLVLAESVKLPHTVALGMRSVPVEAAIYDHLVDSAIQRDSDKMRAFATALSSEASQRFLDNWREMLRSRVTKHNLSAERTISLIQFWPENRSTWEFAASFGRELEQLYWSKKEEWAIRGDTDDLIYAGEHFLQANKAVTAILSLGEGVNALPDKLVFQLLDSAFTELKRNPRLATGMFAYYLRIILDALENRAGVTRAQIARIEWAFSPFLNRVDEI